jgi:hypothetical protein
METRSQTKLKRYGNMGKLKQFLLTAPIDNNNTILEWNDIQCRIKYTIAILCHFDANNFNIKQIIYDRFVKDLDQLANEYNITDEDLMDAKYEIDGSIYSDSDYQKYVNNLQLIIENYI